MAKYKIINVFTLTNRLPVYIKGEIVDGEIHMGDILRVPWNSSIGLEGKISAIEYLDSKEGSFVCLGIDCESSDEHEMWLGMNIQEGETFEISSNT